MAAEFQTVYPNATVLLTAVCDPDSRMHGPNESLHLGDFSKAALAEALWGELGAGTTVLVKGSRGSAMDRIVAALLQRDAGQDGETTDAA